jgi:hypothetical protein
MVTGRHAEGAEQQHGDEDVGGSGGAHVDDVVGAHVSGAAVREKDFADDADDERSGRPQDENERQRDIG